MPFLPSAACLSLLQQHETMGFTLAADGKLTLSKSGHCVTAPAHKLAAGQPLGLLDCAAARHDWEEGALPRWSFNEQLQRLQLVPANGGEQLCMAAAAGALRSPVVVC